MHSNADTFVKWEETSEPLLSPFECEDMRSFIDIAFAKQTYGFDEQEDDQDDQGDGIYKRFKMSDVPLSDKIHAKFNHIIGDSEKKEKRRTSILPKEFRVNHVWFCTKYPSGGDIRPHVDGNTSSEDGTSILTLLIYLNDDFEGGRTLFLEDDEEEELNVQDAVVPKTGHGLLLHQNVMHRAEAVVGTKYILRTDIMVTREK